MAAQAEALAAHLAASRDTCDEKDAELDDLRGDLAASHDSIADLRAEVDVAEADAAERVRDNVAGFQLRRATPAQNSMCLCPVRDVLHVSLACESVIIQVIILGLAARLRHSCS